MARTARTNHKLLTDVELEVMRCLWTRSPASASRVQLQLVREGKETAYTTVKVLLDRLVKSGMCKAKETRGRSYYSPNVTQAEIAREWYAHLRKRIFGR